MEAEQRYYAELYSIADKDHDNKLIGPEAAAFLRTSGLPDKVLEQIWTLADTNGQGYLMQREFAIAMRLIALAQAGKEVSLQNIHQVTSLPRFANIPLPVVVPDLTDDDIVKYDALFTQADQNNDGFVDGGEAKNYLGKSKLPQDVLAKIWTLSEIDGDAKLSKGEFRIAMHLVYLALRGSELPKSLSPSLVTRACQTQGKTVSSAPFGTSTPQQSQPLQSTPSFSSAPQFHPPSSSSLFPAPSTQDGLTFVPVQSAQRHDESRLVNQYALSGASFETRANLTNELNDKIQQRSRARSNNPF